MSEKDWYVFAAVVLIFFSLGSVGVMASGGMMGRWSYPAVMTMGWAYPILGLAVLVAILWFFFRGSNGVSQKNSHCNCSSDLHGVGNSLHRLTKNSKRADAHD
ncbi:hypothetical protein HY994_01865 [Candidatus Micrarchaeota archaeon]|nr:hypothetical protein [Candidatus Micrarchaeota archaeon]